MTTCIGVAAFLTLWWTSAPPVPDVVVGARTDARVTAIGGENGAVAVDAALVPFVIGQYENGSTNAAVAYTADLRLRAVGLTLLPYGLHTLTGAAATGRENGGVRTGITSNIVVGETTFDAVSSTLEQPFGLASTTLVVPILAADVAATAAHRPTQRLRFEGNVRARAYATPPVDENGIPEGAEPLSGVYLPSTLVRGNLVPQFRLGADASSMWTVVRGADAGLRVALDAVTLIDQPSYASMLLAPVGRVMAFRGHEFALEAGVLAVLTPSPKVPLYALPHAALSWSSSTTRAFGFTPGLRVRAALEPFYDAFLVVLTERAGVDAALAFPLSRTLRATMTGNLQIRVFDVADPSIVRRGDDVVAQSAFVLQYAPTPFIQIDTGLNTALRVRLPRSQQSTTTTPVASLFVTATMFTGFGF